MAGGASRSGVWAQMFADALQLQVEISDHAELGTQGVARCAPGVAVGCFTSLREASKVFSKVSRVLQPDRSKKDIYDKKYRRYRRGRSIA